MILFINDIKTIGDLQDKFNLCFQHLKTEFYIIDELCLEEQPISSGCQIGEIRKKHNSGFLQLKSWYTVWQVEQEFHDYFGLNIRILYLKNDLWIKALPGSDLTLEHLNKVSETKEPSMNF